LNFGLIRVPRMARWNLLDASFNAPKCLEISTSAGDSSDLSLSPPSRGLRLGCKRFIEAGSLSSLWCGMYERRAERKRNETLDLDHPCQCIHNHPAGVGRDRDARGLGANVRAARQHGSLLSRRI